MKTNSKMTGRVLVVDDNRDAAAMTALMLGAVGYNVETANCGRTALERVQTFKPDACILDIAMPGIVGEREAGLRYDGLAIGALGHGVLRLAHQHLNLRIIHRIVDPAHLHDQSIFASLHQPYVVGRQIAALPPLLHARPQPGVLIIDPREAVIGDQIGMTAARIRLTLIEVDPVHMPALSNRTGGVGL